MPNWKKIILSGSSANLSNISVDNAVTASYFIGDGSALTNVNANVAEVATVSDTFTSVTSKTVTHNFGTKNVLVSVYNNSDQLVLPATTTTTDDNTVDVTFDTATTGRIVVAKGGHIVSGSASTLDGQAGSYYLDYNNFTNVPDGIISSSTQLSGSTLDAVTLNGPVFGSGSDSPYLTEVRYNNSNVMSFNQVYYGNSNGSYFSSGEYQRVVAIVPSGNSNNYQIVGRMTAQNAGETHTVYFNAALRSNTLPALGWTITYHEEYNGGRYINPLLWTKQTTTAGFILAFETLGTIYGNVTVDMDVIPRSTTLLANVTVNTNQSSEQSSVESGYTSNAFTKVRSQQGTTMEVYGPIVPDTNIAYDIGSSSKRFRDIYLDGSTIDLGGTLIQKDDSGDINFKDSATEALKKVVVNELQIGSGATARKIKVDGDGKIKFSDKDDVATGDDLTLPTGVISGSSQITDLTTYKEEVLNYSSYAIKHDLNEQYPIVQAWNTSTSQQEVPTSITSDSVNQVTVVFSTTFAGVIIVKK
jgi:hypothetical protein